ncbi:acyl-CoA dehydrogenase family protein [Kutzneria kofuensis]|uniref:Alkylation response protein AidB-like acyl-CoA dehydrogenase n=1 Tax=Kutzneria kofuensis TaxID=103725 RepID=A0A7W9KQE2_9PSEU|nr:acyl-CoA dehydrogenase family protein [Kutzneria kofuensis]MBB5896508.1 alkylation response protein AidB-like acyl-CoA dehydrogenase [Kutzneria kofuensis]
MADRSAVRVRDALESLDSLVPLLAANAATVDREARFPAENLDALRAAGLLGLLVPEDHGGQGLGLADLVTVAQRLAGGCLSTAMILAMHCQQVDVLVRHAGPRLRAELLPRIAAGEVYLASVTTEAGTGGHLLSADASLERGGADGAATAEASIRFRRDAPVVTGAAHADGFLITMRDGPDQGEHAVSLVYADRADLDIERYGAWNPMGMRATESGAVRLAGAIRPDQVVGPPGGFRAVALDSMIPVGHLAWSACWLGAARAVFSALVRHLARDGRTDVASPLVRERVARIRLDLELVSAYLGRVREEVERVRARAAPCDAPSLQIHLNSLKIAASELTYRAVDRMVQLAGMSVGYSADSAIPLERALRDLRSAALNYSNDRLWTATGGLCLLDRKVELL